MLGHTLGQYRVGSSGFENSHAQCSVRFDAAWYYFLEFQTVKVKIPRLSLYQYAEIQNLGRGEWITKSQSTSLKTEMRTEDCEETRNFRQMMIRCTFKHGSLPQGFLTSGEDTYSA